MSGVTSPSTLNNEVFPLAPAVLLAGETRFDVFRQAPGAGLGLERLRRGLYAPFPVIGQPGDGDFTLVWGFHTMRAAADAGLRALNCICIPDDVVLALEIALEFEQRPGAYTPAEQYAVWQLLKAATASGHAPVNKDAAARIGPLLGSSGEAFLALMGRYDSLPAAALEAVLNETLDIKTAERCSALPAACLLRLSDADYRAAGLSFSRTRQVFSLLREISLRDELTPADCLKLLNAAIATSDPVAYLRRQRYPGLVRLEQRFEDLRGETTAGSGVELSAPPYFEGESFELRFRFATRAELARRREAVHRIEERFDEFLELL